MEARATKKILIIGPAWVGDMIMAQTLFRWLKSQNPEVIIDVIAPKSTVALLSRMPEVHQGIALDLQHGELNIAARYRLAQQCRATQYDRAIVLNNTFKAALIPWFAGIPIRSGFRREMRQLLLNDCRVLDKQKYPLMIERFVALGLSAGEVMPHLQAYWPTFSILPSEVDHALQKVGLQSPVKPVLALCPGAEYGPSKRWPHAYYAEVAKAQLVKGFAVWLFGGPGDKEITNAINVATGNQCQDLAGKTTLPEAIDLMSLVSSVVSNDSGLMHIAAGLQKPMVVLYGSSSPVFTPPLYKQAVALSTGIACSPCFARECPLGHWKCMRELLPIRVIKALNEMAAL